MLQLSKALQSTSTAILNSSFKSIKPSLSQFSTSISRMSSNPSTCSSSAIVGPSTRPIVMCGPSGVGKSTLIKKLDAEFPGRFGFSVSHTTRSPRPGEKAGVSYHYVTREEFKDLISKGAFLEHAEFGGNLYGTTAKAVDDVSKGEVEVEGQEGKVRRRALLDIDAQGVRLIKANHSNLNPVYIFISPPSFSSLKERLNTRGTETQETISKRLAFSSREMSYARSGAFDAIVVNDDLERAYKVLKGLILSDAREGVERDQLPEKEKEEEEWKNEA